MQQTMAYGELRSPDMERSKVASTAPNSYREWTTNGAHYKSRSSSMGGGLGEFPAVGVPPWLLKSGSNYVSPLRSLYSTAPVNNARASVAINPGLSHAHSHNFILCWDDTKLGHHLTTSGDLVTQMRQRYEQKLSSREAGQSRTPWIIPALAMIQLVAFILAMSHNNCDWKGTSGGENDECIFTFVKRFPFQPLTENPMLGPSAISLLDVGALESELVGQAGQNWRLITTLTLHAGMFHLAGNLACLVYVGVQLEREFGFLAGLAGALASVLFVHGRVSVGSSGASMGLVGARLAEALLNWDATPLHLRTRSIISASLYFLTSIMYGLLPLMDNFMHMGGFIAGSLLGSVLLIRPQADWVKPQQQQLRCFPTVIYDVDDLPVTSKYSHCQKVVWIVSLNLLVAGFVAALFAHFTGADARRGCTWCHYMTCLPTDLWKCYGNRKIVCGTSTQSSHILVDCLGPNISVAPSTPPPLPDL